MLAPEPMDFLADAGLVFYLMVPGEERLEKIEGNRGGRIYCD